MKTKTILVVLLIFLGFFLTSCDDIGLALGLIQIAPEPTAPVAPTNLRIVNSADRSITLAWDPSPTAIGYRIQTYDYYNNTSIALYRETLDTFCTIDLLLDGETYFFDVSAYNNIGDSPSKLIEADAPDQAPSTGEGIVMIHNKTNMEISIDYQRPSPPYGIIVIASIHPHKVRKIPTIAGTYIFEATTEAGIIATITLTIVAGKTTKIWTIE